MNNLLTTLRSGYIIIITPKITTNHNQAPCLL